MMKNYTNFINENNSQIGKRIMKNYKKVIKLVDSFYLPKLNMNIISYYNIYHTLFKNSNLSLNEYEICLLIISSFSRFFNDNKTNIDKLEYEIRKNNIHELYNSSFKILKNTHSLLRIINKSLKDGQILFDNRFALSVLKNYVNNKKTDIYEYNSIFDGDEYTNIIQYVAQFDSVPS